MKLPGWITEHPYATGIGVVVVGLLLLYLLFGGRKSSSSSSGASDIAAYYQASAADTAAQTQLAQTQVLTAGAVAADRIKYNAATNINDSNNAFSLDALGLQTFENINLAPTLAKRDIILADLTGSTGGNTGSGVGNWQTLFQEAGGGTNQAEPVSTYLAQLFPGAGSSISAYLPPGGYQFNFLRDPFNPATPTYGAPIPSGAPTGPLSLPISASLHPTGNV